MVCDNQPKAPFVQTRINVFTDRQITKNHLLVQTCQTSALDSGVRKNTFFGEVLISIKVIVNQKSHKICETVNFLRFKYCNPVQGPLPYLEN